MDGDDDYDYRSFKSYGTCWNEAEFLEALYPDGDDTGSGHIDGPGSPSGKIYNPSGNERSAIINSTDYTLSIIEISHTETSIEWECLMRTGDTVRLESFSISSPLPLPVVACFAVTGFWVTDPVHGGKITDSLGSFVPELDCLLDLNRLVDELCFITIQIMEGTYKGTHGRYVSSGLNKGSSTDQEDE